MIHDSLAEFLENRTTFIITHRQSSLQLADRVVVMDIGRIVSDSSVSEAEAHSEEFQCLFAKSA